MPYTVLKTLALRFRGALLLERVLPHGFRRSAASFLECVVIFLFIPASVYAASLLFPIEFAPLYTFKSAAIILPKLLGFFCFSFALWLLFFMAESFYYSFYFSALDAIVDERGISNREPISFAVAHLVSAADENDLTKSFLRSREGISIMHRSGLGTREIEEFLASRKGKLAANQFAVTSYDHEYGVTLADYALAIFHADKEFQDFLFTKGLQEGTFLGASLWIVYGERMNKKTERFWSRDNLGRIEGIGKEWSYGEVYTLEKYAKSIFDKSSSLAALSSNYLHEEVEALEKVLARSSEANALLVAPTATAPKEVVLAFARRIQEGTILPVLEDKRVIFLDTNKCIAVNGQKAQFERELIKIMEQAIAAGNIILVFDDFPGFIQSAFSIGADVPALLDPYIVSPRIQVIAIADTERFHRELSPNALIMSRFERILFEASALDTTVRILEMQAFRFEARHHLLFTYPALEAIAMSADRYISTGIMPDKAVDMLIELSPAMKIAKKTVVTKEDVLAFVQSKTGIPTGLLTSEERQKLLNLESLLHKRVVGQDEAVSALSRAMRRARSGVSSSNRPMGSFLFLGPTGVGKTETTKTLAEAFFGNENNVIRLDMSEYNSSDALDKIIGSFTSKSPGVLSTALREKPYGVLLLDEFEKSAKEVRDLFLQVIDEGFFSDMSGARVNARNLIIIATSNAGAELIWEYIKKGENVTAHKDEIIDALIKQGVFRPELLNRFDGVILFSPIDNEHLRNIAKLQLEKFRQKIRERGVDIEVNDALVDFLVKFGTDPKFGARPLNRAIQDTIEQNIADRLIQGKITSGQTVTFSQEELQHLAPF